MLTTLTARPRPALQPLVSPHATGAAVFQRKQCACGGAVGPTGECEACRRKREATLQRGSVAHAAGSGVIPQEVFDVLRAPGRPLDASTRALLEPRFGHDFGRVRVHTDAKAAASTRAVRAPAYAVGRDVAFQEGRFAPETAAGMQLLAHELAHVVQQSGAAGPQGNDIPLGGLSSTHEREANDVAKVVASGRPASVRQRTGLALQGAWDWGSAGWGALGGALAGGAIGLAVGGPIGGLVGLLGGALAGGLIGGLVGGNSPQATELRRRCSALMDAVRQHPVYRALASAARAIADEIMALALQRDNCLYYAAKLKLLFDTPEAPPALPGQPVPADSTLERNRARVTQAATAERARLATPAAQQTLGRQEQAADDPGRNWTQRRGRNNKIFLVDRTDPANVVVRIKIRLLAAPGVTTPQDIADEVVLEDAIERVAETHGYTVDVVFVDHDGPDVFTFNVDFDKWPTSANPVGNARTLAHEIHHLMGLPDRYDYIESHPTNRHMAIPQRLHWFREQMNRQPDPQRDVSLMGSGSRMLDDDVCRVAGLDVAACAAARAHARGETP